MDNLTHSLVGVALSRVFFKRRVAYATTAMVIAANLPDLDVLYSWPGIRYIEYHRGVLHSLLMIPLWGLLVAWGLRWFTARRGQAPPAWWLAGLLGATGAASHVLLDWTNIYGVRLFAPFSERWYALDLEPRFDPWIWIILIVVLGLPMLLTLITSEVRSQRVRNPHRLSAVIALALVAGWIGLRARQHAQALDLLNDPYFAGMYDGQLPYDWSALPNRSTPFEWQAVVDLPRNYLIADVTSPWNENYGRVVPVRNYIKPRETLASRMAAATSYGRIMHWYARYPYTQVQTHNGGALVHITDMRYAVGMRRPGMGATITVTGSNQVVGERFRWR
jgi:inner membrane protein